MKYKELVKKLDGVQLSLVGHFSEEELREHKRNGYKVDITQFNKHGIVIGEVKGE